MGELFAYLLGLPASLLLMFFTGRKLLARPATAASSSTALATPATSTVTSTQTSPLAILAASLRLPHGASPEELASAIAENKARADLDKDLVGADGFPIMTARSRDAVDEELQEEIREWLTLNGMAELRFSDEQWRAVTLASTVVVELGAQAAGPLLYQVDTQTRLQLIPILPDEWDVAHRRAVGMWLKHTVARYGWPEDRVMLAEEEVISPSSIFKQLTHNAATTNVPLIAMIVACASYVGDETIVRWADDGSLFTSSHPQGRIPGEGAAGLLITNQLSLVDAEIIALLDELEEARRGLSADESKRSDPKFMVELSERALKHSGTRAFDVSMLIADTGHRSSRSLELMGYVSAGMPQLEETDGVVRVGAATGTCGAVPFIAGLALGSYFAVEREAPVLCVSNEDPYRRVAALMRPLGFPPKSE
jgi:hypothetical protein